MYGFFQWISCVKAGFRGHPRVKSYANFDELAFAIKSSIGVSDGIKFTLYIDNSL